MRDDAYANPQGLKMERSLSLKEIGKTSGHTEAAMTVVDACLAEILKGEITWNYRTFETTGIMKTTRVPGVDWMVLHYLVGQVRITGLLNFKPHNLEQKIEALLGYAGNEEIHDPSGNAVARFHLEGVQIELNDYPRPVTYKFIRGYIPGVPVWLA